MDRTLPVLGESEDLCRRCGASCHQAIGVGDERYIVEEIHCRFLSKSSDGLYACTVYDRRFEAAPWCHKAADAALTGHVAQDCPYASHIPDFHGKRWASPEMRAKLMPAIRRKLIEQGLPLSQSPEAALRVLTADGEDWTWSEEADRYVFLRATAKRSASG